jgi:hypothetical protein
MRNVISSLGVEERRHYDYDLLEQRFMENQDRQIDDEETKRELKDVLNGRKVLLVAPGKSIVDKEAKVKAYIQFSLALCSYAMNVESVRATEKELDHDLSRMRNWLHVLGLTGEEFATCRYHMTKYLKDKKKVADKMCKEHRYLQNEMFKVCLEYIKKLAENCENGWYDPRNQYAAETSKKIIDYFKEIDYPY